MKKISSIIILSALLLSGCSLSPVSNPDNRSNGGVNHIVLLWLKDPGNPRQQQQIIRATKVLEQIPGVNKIRVGTSIPSERQVVDDTFDIGIHMLFDNKAAIKTYVKNPEHNRTINQAIMPFVERIVIYDFEE
ncbi:MAG TPA: Dabb family protein [Candidatus Tenderia electrophaga]|uniref:Dabb family protein n=1 Tax=Candidatus Tenderia electrophaga TaxID=1748243 RepID=A0A832N3B7_9GAMM|nr:Dabb family protein [Candidatus Tenderia electrophaga]